jgi:WD40 repeat protein
MPALGLAFLLLLENHSVAWAKQIQAKVTEVSPERVALSTDSEIAPQVGDRVEIYIELKALKTTALVTTGGVTGINDKQITVHIDNPKSSVSVGQLARIEATEPTNQANIPKQPPISDSGASSSTPKDPLPTSQRGDELKLLAGVHRLIWSVAFSPDGRSALSGGPDQFVVLWNLESGTEIRHVQAGRCYGVAFSPDGSWFVHGDDQSVTMRDTKTFQIRRSLKPSNDEGPISSVAVSPDGRFILSGSFQGPSRLWNAETGAEISHYQMQEDNGAGGHNPLMALRVAFAPDGRLALCASGFNYAGNCDTWDPQTGKQVRVIAGANQNSFVNFDKAVFTPDSRSILSGGNFGQPARVWSVDNGSEVRALMGHPGGTEAVAVSPDGRTILTAGLCDPWEDQPDIDFAIRVWDLQTGQERPRLSGHTRKVRAITFSPNGSTAISGSEDGTVRLWNLP